MPPDTLAAMTWYSINCAYVRLAQIVGLNRMVDTVYRMAQSPYLYPGQPASERTPLQPFVSFSTGANEMAPIDMASGAQTIANDGLHHEPYYVDSIDAADGRRIYTHVDAGTQVLDPNVALAAVGHAEGRPEGRHRSPLPARRRAAGGRQDRHPGRQHERLVRRLHAAAHDRGVGRRPERLHEDDRRPGVRRTARVQGGLYPTQIWKTYMDAALQGQPIEDWAPPPADARKPSRLYLPGNECLARAVTTGGDVVGSVPDAAVTPATPAGLANPDPEPAAGRAAGVDADGDDARGARHPDHDAARRRGSSRSRAAPRSRRTCSIPRAPFLDAAVEPDHEVLSVLWGVSPPLP